MWGSPLYAYQSVSYDEYLSYKNPFVLLNMLSKRIVINKDNGFKNYQIKT